MNILAVDDEKLMLGALVSAIEEAAPTSSIYSFRKASEALDFASENDVDVAFLDIRMRGMDGLELAKELMKIDPGLNVIFCTSYDDYISEAFREVRCNGYVTKPVDAAQIEEELKHLRRPIETKVEKKVRVQCFGYFEAFINGAPIEFGSSKTKELLAYLVHARGAVCSNQELITYLWEDDLGHESYYKKIRKDLFDTLEKYGCADIICKQRAGLGLNTDQIECDYYEWKKKNSGRYPGEYMKQYTWSEFV
ncbi:MAG: response regulator [Clostridiales bacterium]|nr:response regulator [Candidatus Blautia equi]